MNKLTIPIDKVKLTIFICRYYGLLGRQNKKVLYFTLPSSNCKTILL